MSGSRGGDDDDDDEGGLGKRSPPSRRARSLTGARRSARIAGTRTIPPLRVPTASGGSSVAHYTEAKTRAVPPPPPPPPPVSRKVHRPACVCVRVCVPRQCPVTFRSGFYCLRFKKNLVFFFFFRFFPFFFSPNVLPAEFQTVFFCRRKPFCTPSFPAFAIRHYFAAKVSNVMS